MGGVALYIWFRKTLLFAVCSNVIVKVIIVTLASFPFLGKIICEKFVKSVLCAHLY
jgi:hypothetical protein